MMFHPVRLLDNECSVVPAVVMHSLVIRLHVGQRYDVRNAIGIVPHLPRITRDATDHDVHDHPACIAAHVHALAAGLHIGQKHFAVENIDH